MVRVVDTLFTVASWGIYTAVLLYCTSMCGDTWSMLSRRLLALSTLKNELCTCVCSEPKMYRFAFGNSNDNSRFFGSQSYLCAQIDIGLSHPQLFRERDFHMPLLSCFLRKSSPTRQQRRRWQ